MNGACRGRNCVIWLQGRAGLGRGGGRGAGGGGSVQLDIDLNPQIVCSNKLFQVALPLPPSCCLCALLAASTPLPPSAVVLGNALHLPDAISQWATRAGTIVVYTNNLLRGGKMHHCLLCPCLLLLLPLLAALPDCPTFEIFSLLFCCWSRVTAANAARPRG